MAVTRARAALLVAALVAYAAHLGLVFHFVAPQVLLSDDPIDGADYDTHIGQTYRVLEGLERWGQLWVYDVQLLAGQPEGTIFDADNKGWELWTFTGVQLGMTKGRAFNSFVLAAHAAAPLLAALAAWLLGLGAWAALLAGVLASCVWFFDSWVHWGWWIGMVAYTTASVFYLVPFALFDRFVRRGSLASGVAFVPALALAHLQHPYVFFMLAVPLAVMYLRSRRVLPARSHALVALAVIATLALNMVWLLPAFAHWHYILDSAFFGRTGLAHLASDFFNVLRDPSDGGVIGTRAGFRFACLAMTVALLLAWRKSGDDRRFAFGSALLALFVLGYLGSYLPGGAQVQPYRFIMPLTFLACIGAAGFVERLVRERALSGLGPGARALLVVCGLGALQHLARDVIYFVPDTLPAVRPMIDGRQASFAATGHPPVLAYRIPRPIDRRLGLREKGEWLRAHARPGERVLIEDTHLGEHVAWRSGLEVLGGFRHRNIAHSYANFFRHFERKQATHAQLHDYLRTYAVRWIVASRLRADLNTARDLLEKIRVEGGHVYRSRLSADKVLRGGGTVQGRTNRIEVRGSTPGEDLVLSYHFHERLACTPGCRIERAPSAFDRVGLIRVPAPHPSDLVIALEY